MTLRVSNTLTGEREEFEPSGDEVLVYVCGLTVSDLAHLGHARVWIHADVMHRWLAYCGHDVRHVENFTDVNEKIVARTGEDDLGADEASVAHHFVSETIEDMRSLNLRRAEVYPRVSEHIPEIIEFIETLLERGYAYESNGSVYFDVTQFEDYGKLSNQRVEELEGQGNPDELADKRHPADFALWKAGPVTAADVAEHREEDLPSVGASASETWDSPWGEGRPGWHIECSAMSTAHLGDTLDIHLGGQDLVFPHHENEIAQSEAATGKQFARYWLHVRLLETGGEKMSSSLGNFLTVREAVSTYGPNVVRTFLLSTAYTQRQTYSLDAIEEAEKRWDRLQRAYDRAVDACDSVDARTKVEDDDLRGSVGEQRDTFESAMDDDFNTREALAALLELASAANRHVDRAEAYDYQALRRTVETFEELGGDVLGLVFAGEGEGETRLAGELVDLLLDIREAEREAGNYERADELRDDLSTLGVEVQDTDDGPEYRL